MGLNRALMTEAVGLMEAGAAAEEMVDMVEEETRGTKPSLHPILPMILRSINHLRAIITFPRFIGQRQLESYRHFQQTLLV